MNKTKQAFMAFTVSGLLLSGGLVGAQTTQNQSGGAQSTSSEQAKSEQVKRGMDGGHDGFRGGFHGGGVRGLPFGPLALGTTVEVTLYDGDPGTGGTAMDTLNFTYGEDSEAAFAEQLAQARQNAQYIQVNVGEQTRTVDLAQVEFVEGRGLLPREIAFRRGLEDGDSVSATFYDGDPEAGGSEQQTLSFTYGQDSEAGFADSFTSAAQNASFVTVMTSPQSYTVNLSARNLYDDDRHDDGRRGFGGPGRGRGFGGGRR